MRRNRVIQRFEYESLKVDDTFREEHFNSLVKLSEKSKQQLFKVGNRKVTFQNFVGVLQVRDLTIEILPKADNNPKSDVLKWRNALYEMLRITRRMNIRSKSNAKLDLKRGSLFDLYLESFLDEIDDLIRQGLQKRYVRIEENVNYYKGRVNFGKQFSCNAGNLSMIFTEFDSYELDHSLHRVLFGAIDLIPHLTANPSIYFRAKSLRDRLPRIPKCSYRDLETWRKAIDMNTFKYQSALSFAELIIRTLSPMPQVGSYETIAMLFDMNTLFEEFVTTCLRRSGTDHGLRVRRQVSKKFWESRSIKPDIVIEFDGQTFVVDTKWKVLKEAKPSDEDLKQIYAYNNYFESRNSVLLYPNVHDLPVKIGRFHRDIQINAKNQRHTCSVAFVNLFDEDEQLLDPKAVGKLIWDQICYIEEKAA